jgi:hypothetical protein
MIMITLVKINIIEPLLVYKGLVTIKWTMCDMDNVLSKYCTWPNLLGGKLIDNG